MTISEAAYRGFAFGQKFENKMGSLGRYRVTGHFLKLTITDCTKTYKASRKESVKFQM